jgi:predicted SprT family Zn-dependent metalloprotease
MRDRTPNADRIATRPKLLARWANTWGLPGLCDALDISFSMRLRRSLGRSTPARGRITLHHALRDAPSALVTEVLCHEAAHVAAFHLYGRRVRPHGEEWRRLVVAAGYTPRTCAEYPPATLSSRASPTRPRFLYDHRCPVCHTTRSARRPVSRWRCSECVAIGLPGDMLITRRSRLRRD